MYVKIYLYLCAVYVRWIITNALWKTAIGSFTVTLDDGHEKISYYLKRPYYGQLAVPGIWRDLDDFSGGSVLLCMASEHYDEKDYIREYDEFVKYKHKGEK